jgi:hypothetical protein
MSSETNGIQEQDQRMYDIAVNRVRSRMSWMLVCMDRKELEFCWVEVKAQISLAQCLWASRFTELSALKQDAWTKYRRRIDTLQILSEQEVAQ